MMVRFQLCRTNSIDNFFLIWARTRFLLFYRTDMEQDDPKLQRTRWVCHESTWPEIVPILCMGRWCVEVKLSSPLANASLVPKEHANILRIVFRSKSWWNCTKWRVCSSEKYNTARKGQEPSHVIHYDDGEKHAVRLKREGDNKLAVDEDGDELQCEVVPFNR